jgi:tripartite-type tricarboxylate transporter receptor subunit TctC
MFTRRTLLTSAAAGAFAASTIDRAQPQFEDAIVRVVVGFAAGGPTDVIARLIVEQLRTTYAPKAIVENKPGAAGRLAIDLVKKSPPDGSVFLLTPGSPLTIYPHVYKKLDYNPVQDLTPVTTVGVTGYALSVGPMVPANVRSLADFIAWCKANPAKAAYASPAAGSTPHFVGAKFAKSATLDMQHVAYRGSAPAMQDLLGGQLASASTLIFDTLAHSRGGGLRVLATSGSKRSQLLPDTPTFAEQGFSGFEVQEWLGFFLPPKANAAIVDDLSPGISSKNG